MITMTLRSLCKDKVALVKITGEKYENVIADVHDDYILVPSVEVPIDEEDQFIRELPQGRQEVYEVTNTIYYGTRFGSFEPHYEVNVRKVLKSSQKLKALGDSGHSIHITGNNSPVIIDSNGNYINIDTSSINNENVFEKLRESISKTAVGENKEKLLYSVDELEKAKGTPGYVKAYKSLMQVAKD